MSTPVLSKEDLRSAVWMKLQKHLETRLQALRETNDSDLPAEKTARHRGRIAEVKAMLNLASEQPPVMSPELPD